MKRLAATAFTLMITAAIGTAAANPYDNGGNGHASRSSWNQDQHSPADRANPGPSNAGNRELRGSANAYSYRNAGHDYRDGRYGGRDDYGYRGGARYYHGGWYGNRAGWYGYHRGWYGYRGGWRHAPGYVSVVVGGAPYYYDAPAYYDAEYQGPGPAYGYGYEAGPGYGYDAANGCPPGSAYAVPVRRDNTGAKLLGAVVGGALGNTVGKGNGRAAATVAGAAIGYGVASDATRDRGYEMGCGG